jgi:hypothetical protein
MMVWGALGQKSPWIISSAGSGCSRSRSSRRLSHCSFPRHARLRARRRRGGRRDRDRRWRQAGSGGRSPLCKLPTNAGWARSIRRIPTRLNGASCQRIPPRRASASPAAAPTVITGFSFPVAPPPFTITKASPMTASCGSMHVQFYLRPESQSMGGHQPGNA